MVIEAKKEKERQAHEENMMKMQIELAKFQRVTLGTGGGIGVPPGQPDVDLLGSYSAFIPSQSGKAVGGNTGIGEGGFGGH